MYSYPQGNSANLSRDAVGQIIDLCSAGLSPDAIGVLKRNRCSRSNGSAFLADAAHVALEHSNYECAFDAYTAACRCAASSGKYESVSILEKLCDVAHVMGLLSDSGLSEVRQARRQDIDEAIIDICVRGEHPRILPLMSKLLIALGEVGAPEKTTKWLSDWLANPDLEFENLWGPHKNNMITAFVMTIAAHELLADETRIPGQGVAWRSRGYYETARAALHAAKAFPELQSYLSLRIARLHGERKDGHEVKMNFLRATTELEQLAPEDRPLASVVMLVKCIADHAVFFPELMSLHGDVVDRFGLPIHHHISALAFWTAPPTLQEQLERETTEEGQESIVAQARAMIRRAEFLAAGVDQVPIQDSVQLLISKASIAALFDQDYYSAFSEAYKAFRIAARNPGATPGVMNILERFAWTQQVGPSADELRDMFDELLQVEPKLPPPHGATAAEFKCLLVVGLVNALEWTEATLEEQRKTLLPAMKQFMEFLFDTEREDYNIESPALAAILRSGHRVWLSLPVGADRNNCAKVLTTLYQRKSPLPPEDELEWLRDARDVEQIARLLYISQGKTREAATAQALESALTARIDKWTTDAD
jgi:hypothetical protein